MPLAIGVRYVNMDSKAVVEEWISFIKMASANSESIFNNIIEELEQIRLPVEMCIGGNLP